MKFGDPLIYTENGVEYSASFLRSRELDDHSGADGEPLVDLVFIKPVMAPGPGGKMVEKDVVGTSQQFDIFNFRSDVAHESHEFEDDVKHKYVSQYSGSVLPAKKGDEDQKPRNHVTYPGGRWKELELSVFTGRQVVEERAKDAKGKTSKAKKEEA